MSSKSIYFNEWFCFNVYTCKEYYNIFYYTVFFLKYFVLQFQFNRKSMCVRLNN